MTLLGGLIVVISVIVLVPIAVAVAAVLMRAAVPGPAIVMAVANRHQDAGRKRQRCSGQRERENF